MSVFPHPNDPHGFTPQCTACDDNGCDLCCPTIPVTLEDLDDMPFPTDHPHVHANRLEAQEPDDKGACYLERIDPTRIIVKVRSPGEMNESSVSIPWDIWLKMIMDHGADELKRSRVDELQAKLHCVCGDPVDHSPWSGHSPVSMFDHAVEQEVQRRLLYIHKRPE